MMQETSKLHEELTNLEKVIKSKDEKIFQLQEQVRKYKGNLELFTKAIENVKTK